MTAYKLKDLAIMLGEVNVYNMIWFIALSIVALLSGMFIWRQLFDVYQDYKGYKLFRKNFNRVIDNFEKRDKERRQSLVQEMSLEEIHEVFMNRDIPEHKQTTKAEARAKTEAETKDEVVEETEFSKLEKNPNKTEPEVNFIKEPLGNTKQTTLEEIVTSSRAWRLTKWSNSSKDRELYPEVFKEMEDLKLELHKYYWVVQIARMIWVTWASLNWITTRAITTIKTANKYIEGFKKILAQVKDMDKKPTPPVNSILNRSKGIKSKEVNPIKLKRIKALPADKVTALETYELNRLIDTLLATMTQGELGMRISLSQPTISDISRRRTKKSSLAKMYIKKLQSVERMTLGWALSNSGL